MFIGYLGEYSCHLFTKGLISGHLHIMHKFIPTVYQFNKCLTVLLGETITDFLTTRLPSEITTFTTTWPPTKIELSMIFMATWHLPALFRGLPSSSFGILQATKNWSQGRLENGFVVCSLAFCLSLFLLKLQVFNQASIQNFHGCVMFHETIFSF